MAELQEHIDTLLLLKRLPNNRIKFKEAMAADSTLREATVSVFCDGVKFKTVTDIHKSISTLQNNILDRIIDCFSPSQPGYKIAASCADMVDGPQDLKSIIGDLISQRSFTRKQEVESIMGLMPLMGITDPSTVEPNHHAGVNRGFVVTLKDGSKKFGTATDGKIDPSELIVYKILQYMNLGPHTQFLIRQYSIGHGTAIRGNFIATDDLNADGWTFYLDSAEHQGLFTRALSTSATANVELSVLSAVNDVLLLGDTFGENPKNYGLLHHTEANEFDEYRFMAVDHLPRSNNATFPPYRFSPGEIYSPRASVQKRVDLVYKRYQQKDEEVALHGDRGLDMPPIERGRATYPRAHIECAVNARLSELAAAVDQALGDVLAEISAYERSFYTESRARVHSYVVAIKENIRKLNIM